MALFKKKGQPEVMEKAVLKTGFKGTELHVNPPPNVSLARMEARLVRVKKSIASGKWQEGESKMMEFQTIQRRLEAQIAIYKGEI